MPDEETSKQWRALEVSGETHVLPQPVRFGENRWRVRGEYLSAMGNSPRRAVIAYAAMTLGELVEVRGPGELFAHEQVESAIERCAVLLDRAAEHHEAIAAACKNDPGWSEAVSNAQLLATRERLLAAEIRSSKELPQ